MLTEQSETRMLPRLQNLSIHFTVYTKITDVNPEIYILMASRCFTKSGADLWLRSLKLFVMQIHTLSFFLLRNTHKIFHANLIFNSRIVFALSTH
jgi:hypothetical protein